MSRLILRALCSPTGEFDLTAGRTLDRPGGYDVLVYVERELDGRPRVLVGMHLLTQLQASKCKALVDLWNRVPALSNGAPVGWEGWTPPASELPIGKLGVLFKLAGLTIGPATPVSP